ncbi:DoxX family protein [Sphingobacterium lumbrici]|uniref:DoxX family protein n=1 Tax=Sphingobacterium lumbrici TaxID=2559600 RepID=UPI00112D5321|nr:DoxX family protein [Sphingobacterium lumbrici]
MSRKTIKRAGWTLTIILGLLFAFSAFMKLVQDESTLAQAAAMGFAPDTYLLIGVIEILSLILFLIPRTGFIGALLLVAYMGGAIASHLQHDEPIAMAVTVQIVLWITIVFRFPVIKQMLIPVAKSN